MHLRRYRDQKEGKKVEDRLGRVSFNHHVNAILGFIERVFPLYKSQGKQNQPRTKEIKKGRGNGGNQRRTVASVTSGSNRFTFTSKQFENLMRNVLKDMKPGASTGDCTDDELEFVVGMICLNAATNNALFYWIIDTGASNHMTPFCKDMINAKILETLPKITLPNGDSSKITQIGQVQLKNDILLKDVLCVPTFKFSLLLVSKLTKDNNCIAIFSPNFYVIQDLRTRRVQGLGRKIGGMYHLLNVLMDQVDAKLRIDVENSVNYSLFSYSAGVYNNAICPNMYSLWHHRLGHISVTKMKHVQSFDIPVANDNETTCLTCRVAKLTKLPYAYSESCSSSVFELISYWIFGGPYKVPTTWKF
ncbi:cysteine-rich receptor-like protein kinase 8 [Tanacetum coccineum]